MCIEIRWGEKKDETIDLSFSFRNVIQLLTDMGPCRVSECVYERESEEMETSEKKRETAEHAV